MVSAQPKIDAGEIRHSQFRLAMAAGNKRHYRINTVAARHSVEATQRAGTGEKIMASIFEELWETTMNAVTNTVAHLPKNFPDERIMPVQQAESINALPSASHPGIPETGEQPT